MDHIAATYGNARRIMCWSVQLEPGSAQFERPASFDMETAQRMARIAQRETDPRVRLERVVHEGLPLDAARLREWKVWIVFWAAAASNELLASENAERYDAWRDLLASLLATLDPGLDAEARSLELVALVDGLGIRATLVPTPANRRLARETIDRWISEVGSELGVRVGGQSHDSDPSNPQGRTS